MANSPTDICNLSLDLLSANTILDAEIPSTSSEELCNRWYDKSRKKVLREHPWNFATKRASLAASSTAPAFEYDYAYPVPADFVRLLCVLDDSNNVVSPEEYEFEDNSILSNMTAPLRIKYIYDFQDVPNMDAMFVDALVYEIALGIVYKVGNSNTDVERVAKLLQQRVSMAKAIDGQERPPRRVERSNNLTARRTRVSERTDRY